MLREGNRSNVELEGEQFAETETEHLLGASQY